MPVIAIAGGSGGLGQAIAEAVIAEGKFEVIVLSRRQDKELEKKLDVPVHPVDYSRVDSLTASLEELQVHTVICVLGGMDPTEPQLALIQASDRSSVTKRFIPSVFGLRYQPEHSWFFGAAPKIAAEAALEKTNLEWTMVCNGWFLDYFGMPNIKTCMKLPIVLGIDVAAKKAAIPGSGNTPIVFTYSFDAAKYTAAILSLDKWDKVSYVIGDRLTWNELLKIAEEACGTKFDVTYDSLDLLRSKKCTELPNQSASYDIIPKEAYQLMSSTFGVILDEGKSSSWRLDESVNRFFPNIKPKSAKEILETAWKK
ncbi:hypothetical protein F5884DRAFT_342272 [Xylogone sp. PMI_703]|nr:hypothetical protein F5884DRAFT_342272 [Xylogone sp. PMI_703]